MPKEGVLQVPASGEQGRAWRARAWEPADWPLRLPEHSVRWGAHGCVVGNPGEAGGAFLPWMGAVELFENKVMEESWACTLNCSLAGFNGVRRALGLGLWL